MKIENVKEELIQTLFPVFMYLIQNHEVGVRHNE